MSAILKFDLQTREQLRFSEVNYLNYTQKTQFLHVATTFSLKQGETRTSHGRIPHPLNNKALIIYSIIHKRVFTPLRDSNNRGCQSFFKLKNEFTQNFTTGH